MKKLFALILILSICAATVSCSKGGGKKGEPLRLVFCDINIKSAQGKAKEKAFEYLNTVLLPSEGFNIEFVIGPSYPRPHEYQELLEKGHVVLGDYYKLSRVYPTKETQSLSAYEGIAPTVFDRHVLDDQILILTNDKTGIDTYDLVALIKNDVYNDYKADTNNAITSIDEYEVFLDWVSANKPALTPVVATPLHDSFSLSYDIFKLFLPKYGYVPIGGGNTTITLGVTTPISPFAHSLFMDMKSGTIRELGKIPEQVLTSFVNDAKRWQQKYQLIRKESEYKEFKSSAEFASVLTELRNARSGSEITLSRERKDLTIDPADYHIFTLNSGFLPKDDSGSAAHQSYQAFIMAKEGVDASELFRFLESMHTDVGVYTKMIYGKEGVDYKWSDDNKIIRLEKDIQVSDATWELTNPFMEDQLKIKALPVNYNETINSMEYIDIPGYYDILARAQSLLGEDRERVMMTLLEKLKAQMENTRNVMQLIAAGKATNELVQGLTGESAELRRIIDYLNGIN